MLYEVQRNDVSIVKLPIADTSIHPGSTRSSARAAAPFALQMHRYFSEVTRVGWPVPHTLHDEDSVEVIYIDHNHLHMVGNVDPGVASNYGQ